MTAILAALGLMLIAAPAGGQSDLDDWVARIEAAIERAGCLATPDNQDAIIRDSGLGSEQPGLALEALFAQGRVRFDGPNLRLISPNCPDAAELPPAPEALVRLVGEVRDAGCTMPLALLDERLRGPQADPALREGLARLSAAGLAGPAEHGLAYVLAPALCAADDTALERALAQIPAPPDLPRGREGPPMLPATLASVTTFAQAARVRPDRSLPQREARVLLDRNLLGRLAVRESLGRILERVGIVRPTDAALVLDPELCAAAPAALPVLLRQRLTRAGQP